MVNEAILIKTKKEISKFILDNGMSNIVTTHIPIEQISALRSMPNLNVIRPASSEELYLTWFEALSSTSTPTVIILSREVCDFKTHNKDILLRGYRVNEMI